MKVLRANEEQYNLLNNYKNKTSKLKFAKDLDGNWIVGEEVLEDESFTDILAQLNELELIDYKEIPYEG